MKANYQEQEFSEVDELMLEDEEHAIVLFNDDYNTFDHVIETLIAVCKHTPEQAEQCTFLVHYKGKCKVKEGSVDFLKPMKEAICERGIDARIF